jgi:hypothetical protein
LLLVPKLGDVLTYWEEGVSLDCDLSFQKALEISAELKPDICHIIGQVAVFYHKMNFSDESLECLAMIKFAKVCHVSLDIREGSSYCVLPSILKRNVISHLYLCLFLLNFPQLPEVASAIEKPTISELLLQVGLGPQGLELASAIGEMKHLLILKLSHYVTDFDLYFLNISINFTLNITVNATCAGLPPPTVGVFECHAFSI